MLVAGNGLFPNIVCFLACGNGCPGIVLYLLCQIIYGSKQFLNGRRLVGSPFGQRLPAFCHLVGAKAHLVCGFPDMPQGTA